jgi:calcineurin-like phosphoesterase family protein
MRINIDHQRIWFASDYHFCHANVIKYDGRPFNNVEEMNQTLIDNWNEVVGDDDVVFYLGDERFI